MVDSLRNAGADSTAEQHTASSTRPAAHHTTAQQQPSGTPDDKTVHRVCTGSTAAAQPAAQRRHSTATAATAQTSHHTTAQPQTAQYGYSMAADGTAATAQPLQ